MYELHPIFLNRIFFSSVFIYTLWSLDLINIFALVNSFEQKCKDLIEVSKHYKIMQTHTHKLYIFQMCFMPTEFYTLLSQAHIQRIFSYISQ